MDLELAGKRVLVTGASRGIGLAIAEAFSSEGASVTMVARTEPTLHRAADRLGADWYAFDCSESADWDMVKGSYDAVIANIGDGQGQSGAIPDARAFAQTWKQNFTVAEVTARVALERLLGPGGTLTFVASIAGVESIGAPTDYATAKTAVISLAKHLARKVAPEIRVNCVAPGNVLAQGGVWDRKRQADPTGVEAMLQREVPMGRFGTPGEIADAVLFLASGRAAFVTGACLVVDGGQTRHIL